jgi:hypothetical protein
MVMLLLEWPFRVTGQPLAGMLCGALQDGYQNAVATLTWGADQTISGPAGMD